MAYVPTPYVLNADAAQLFRAAERNDLKRVQFMIENEKAPATLTNVAGQTLAHIAARNGYFKMLVYITEKDPSVLKMVDSNRYSVLYLTIEEGDFRAFKYLVDKHKVDVCEPSKRGWGAAVHTAIEFNRLDILKYLIDVKGVDVNERGKLEYLPAVFLAVKYQPPHNSDIVHYLIDEKKADLTLVDANGENILYAIARKNDLQLMRRILDEMGVQLNVNQQNYLGETPVHVAADLNRYDVLAYLVDEKGAEVNLARRRDFMTPLHCAASRNYYNVCRYLVERGADTQTKDELQQTAAQKASDKRLVEMLNVTTTPAALTRRRRNVGLPVQLLSSESLNSRGLLGRNDRPLMNQHFALQVHNVLFLAAEAMIGHVDKPRIEFPSFPAPRTFLENRMDPAAVDAVNNIPRFLKE